jgi:hypothetical protein
MPDFYKKVRINGKTFTLALVQIGNGAPSATTPGVMGIQYMDSLTGNLYKCTGSSAGVQVWERIPNMSDISGSPDTTGGNIQGGLNVSNAYENGCGSLYKNNSAEADYGTVLSDTSKSGDKLELVLQANTKRVFFRYNGELIPFPVERIADITLLAANWVGDASPYSQVVQIDGVTQYSQVDLTPSVEQLVIFHEKDLTLTAKNVGGVVTVYAVGQRPENDYVMQATIKEVAV